MKSLLRIVSLLVLMTGFKALADSRINDVERLRNCGGSVALRSSANGDLALQLSNLNTGRCGQLRFFDVSSGRTLKSYSIQGTSYTLSKSMRSSLSSDCRVGFTVSNGSYISDTFNVVMDWCSSSTGGGSSSRQSFQLSNNGNCKLLINGQYQNRNVSINFCQGARGKDIVSYERSNKGNCKLMINNIFSNQLVSDYYCSVRL